MPVPEMYGEGGIEASRRAVAGAEVGGGGGAGAPSAAAGGGGGAGAPSAAPGIRGTYVRLGYPLLPRKPASRLARALQRGRQP